jgi:nitrate/nitrite transport system permease protein
MKASGSGIVTGATLSEDSAAKPATNTLSQWRAAFAARATRSIRATVMAMVGIGAVCAVWQIICLSVAPDLPTPLTALTGFVNIMADPFYDTGPNDKGIGLQLLYSLRRVFIGFAIGSLIALPVGFMFGLSAPCRAVFNPIVQILRPVSPMAWFPIGLAVLKVSDLATIFVITVTSLWPTLINTAAGVSSLPDDYRNVARVFAFSRATYFRKVLLPYSLPHIITGFRLSLGVGWMVIVAGEMLAGGTGIGFFVWDSWNSLNLTRVISAIILIGLIGFAIDAALMRLYKYVTR